MNIKKGGLKFQKIIPFIPIYLIFNFSIQADSGQAIPLFKMTFYPCYFELRSGKATVLELTLENTGNKPLNHITFDIQTGNEFQIAIDPPAVESLNQGESVKLSLTARPEKAVFQRTSQVSLIAKSDQCQTKESIQFVVSAPEGLWMKIGMGLVLCVIIIFIIVFFRTGKDKTEYQEVGHDQPGA